MRDPHQSIASPTARPPIATLVVAIVLRLIAVVITFILPIGTTRKEFRRADLRQTDLDLALKPLDTANDRTANRHLSGAFLRWNVRYALRELKQ